MAGTIASSLSSSSTFFTLSSSSFPRDVTASADTAAEEPAHLLCHSRLPTAAIIPVRRFHTSKLRRRLQTSCCSSSSLPRNSVAVAASQFMCRFGFPAAANFPERQQLMIRKTRCLQSERVYTESKQDLDTAQIPHRLNEEDDSAEDSTEDDQESENFDSNSAVETGGEEDYGEVNKILASRVVDRGTEYLIEWKDDHLDSWEPAANIARDVMTEYENPWWQAARKADEKRLSELLQDEGRNVDAIDENERTALLFAAGMGSELCVRQLVEAGADINWQDKDGFTAIHIAAGYVHISVVKILLEFGADPDLEDSKGRSALGLAQELLERTPKANPMQFARRLALDQIVKLLDEALYETVEVEQVLDKRVGESGSIEYLVRWSDGSDQSWVQMGDVGEDLVRDYEAGLEYGIAEKVLEKRLRDGQVEYLVKWADSEKNTWEPADNVATDVIAEFENAPSIEEIKKS